MTAINITVPVIVLPDSRNIITVFGALAAWLDTYPDYVRVEHVEITPDAYSLVRSYERNLGKVLLNERYRRKNPEYIDPKK